MNYLAHAFLSFGNPDILAGNMMADFVKGKKALNFSDHIQAGIHLHHAIDEFTDTHEANRQAKDLMYAATGRYSGVFTDIIYDHFLALDKQYFNPASLSKFAQHTYHTIEQYHSVFPDSFKNVFFYMETYDWLSGYGNEKNIDRSFKGIYHRAKFLPESEEAFHAFKNHYQELKHCYEIFMPEVINFASNQFDRLSKDYLLKKGI